MTQVVRFLFVLLVLSGLLPHRGQAASYLAGELTYTATTNGVANQYRVRLLLFRDCAGAAFNQTETLSCRVGSPQTACASTDPRNFTATFTRLTLTTGAPYCTPSPNPLANQCNPNAPFNYEIAYFEAFVILPPAPEWTLSWEGGTRAALGNLANADTQPLRLEATLRNQLTLAPGVTRDILNESAQFTILDLAVQGALPNQLFSLTSSAYEGNADSLVYSLAAPQGGCNQPMAYQTFAPGGLLPLPAAAGQACQATLPVGSPTVYSPRFPFPAFLLAGSCPLQTATPTFQFHSQTGTLSGQLLYYPETTPADRARNRYAVVTKVTEYRLINGRHYEVGSVSRNQLVAVIDPQFLQFPNHAPRFDPTILVNGQSQLLTDTIRVARGQTVRVVLTASDPDGAHQTRLSTPANLLSYPANSYVLPAGAYLRDGSVPNRLELTLTPPAAMPPGAYIAAVTGETNTCPSRESMYIYVPLRVTAQVLSAASPSQPLLTTAAPNPFTDAVTLRVSNLPAPTHLTVTNLLGQPVAELPLRPVAGTAEVTWRVTGPLPAGVYLARVAGTGQTLRLLHR